MTVFANQTPNLVFASPDGSNGQPDFRALTANDVAALDVVPSNVVVANVECANSVEYYVLSSLIQANTVPNGLTVHLMMAGKQGLFVDTNTGQNCWPWVTYSLRFGPNGNTTDPLIYTEFTPTRNPQSGLFEVVFLREWYATLQANGSNSNVVVVSRPDFSGPSNDWTTITTTQVDLTVNNYIGMTFNANNSFQTIEGQSLTPATATAQNSNVQFGVIEEI